MFFQAQALLDVVLSLSFLVAIRNTSSWGGGDFLGVLIWVVAVVGESVADRQLERFRTEPANRGKTCRMGLWRYSRHPNYFFEWLVWCGIGLAALAAPLGWLALASPAIMLFLILKVTGIPPTEERAVLSRGKDYRDYQATTSAFVPWLPKKESTV